MSLFLALFALDALTAGRSSLRFQGSSSPSAGASGAGCGGSRVALPVIGAVAFAGLALAYSITVRWRLGWIAVISGPLVVLAILFTASSRYRADAPSA